MEDIVDRLRVLNFTGPWKEAANEIERLRKELKESNANHELYERRWYLRENEVERLRNNQSILITSFRINMMRLCPDYSHEEFDKDIAVMLKEKE